ncbi:hypothetical protein [Actinomadura sp. J1-007]|nr:hypothetical protein [Actinomadura sp. J1-007]
MDHRGVTTTYQRPPQRAVSLNQHAIKVMPTLGLQDSMVATGCLDDRLLPEYRAAYGKTKVISKEYPSFDALPAAEPDFVYGLTHVRRRRGSYVPVVAAAAVAVGPVNVPAGQVWGTVPHRPHPALAEPTWPPVRETIVSSGVIAGAVPAAFQVAVFGATSLSLAAFSERCRRCTSWPVRRANDDAAVGASGRGHSRGALGGGQLPGRHL